MNTTEREATPTEANYTRAVAYMAAFCLVAAALLVWGAITLASDAKARVERIESSNSQQDKNISTLDGRVGIVEREIQHAKADREAAKEELLGALRGLQKDLQPIKEYVIEQKAREAERDRIQEGKSSRSASYGLSDPGR